MNSNTISSNKFNKRSFKFVNKKNQTATFLFGVLMIISSLIIMYITIEKILSDSISLTSKVLWIITMLLPIILVKVGLKGILDSMVKPISKTLTVSSKHIFYTRKIPGWDRPYFFRSNSLPKLEFRISRDMFYAIESGDEVTIEYSPFLNTVSTMVVYKGKLPERKELKEEKKIEERNAIHLSISIIIIMIILILLAGTIGNILGAW